MDTLVTRKVIVAKLVTRYLFQDQSWGAIVYRLIMDRVQLSPINNKLESSSYLKYKENRTKEYQDFIIRVLDIILACLAIVLLLPLLCLIAISVKTAGRGPILFSHPRLGVDGRTFGCWKFRTMRIDARQQLLDLLARDPKARAEWQRNHKLRNDPRVTPLGVFLRRSSIDELPQLYNVLIGDMSIVGPRPIVTEERPRYGRHYSQYCAVKPGITGLWQVSGRNNTTYRRRVACDVVYARHRSLKTNSMILLRTIPAVLFNRGSY